jgi:zinc protease
MQTAEALVYAQLDDRGIDFAERRTRLIEGATLDDARRVARRLLDPDKLLIVIVGKPEGVSSTAAPEPADGSNADEGLSEPTQQP